MVVGMLRWFKNVGVGVTSAKGWWILIGGSVMSGISAVLAWIAGLPAYAILLIAIVTCGSVVWFGLGVLRFLEWLQAWRSKRALTVRSGKDEPYVTQGRNKEGFPRCEIAISVTNNSKKEPLRGVSAVLDHCFFGTERIRMEAALRTMEKSLAEVYIPPEDTKYFIVANAYLPTRRNHTVRYLDIAPDSERGKQRWGNDICSACIRVSAHGVTPVRHRVHFRITESGDGVDVYSSRN